VLQATTRAMENIKKETPTKKSQYSVSDISFETLAEADVWYKQHCTYMITVKHKNGTTTSKKYGKSEYGLYQKVGDDLAECTPEEATHIKYRGDSRELQSETDTRNSTDLGQGVKTSARIMPVRSEEGTIRYIVIYKPV
jgi:hypothetical protein